MTPCPNSLCREHCRYEADAYNISVNKFSGIGGKIFIETFFEKSKYEINYRTLLRIEPKIPLYTWKYLIDEMAVFDPQDYRMLRLYEHRHRIQGLFSKKYKYARWIKTLFLTTRDKSGTHYRSISKKLPKDDRDMEKKNFVFAKYITTDESKFSRQWFSDFDQAMTRGLTTTYHPNEMKDLGHEVLPPTFISFFHVRFLDPEVENYQFLSFAPKTKEKILPLNFKRITPPQQLPRSYHGPAYLGKYINQEGKPSLFVVDKNRQLSGFEIHVRDQKGKVFVSAKLVNKSCNLTPQ